MKGIFYLSILVILATGCGGPDEVRMISSNEGTAESVYLTHDERGNPVVVWTERRDDDLALFFATSTDDGQTFREKIAIPLSADVATHPEGMPKVAFRRDGTIVAAYEKKAPTTENKYASAVCYVMSNDRGMTWTRENFIHSDTVPGKSRSYFDIERLPDGEIGASWLDVTLDAETRGRSVLFARTSPSGIFGNEVLIDSSACQCCRIDVYTDATDNIFVAYRGLMSGPVGKQVRDMMIATSTDHGKTFSSPFRVSVDNWNIDGCPHTGPSLCSNKAGLISLWYTEGSGTGIYYAQKANDDKDFAPRQLVSGNGHHPQLCAKDDRTAMLWEENIEYDGQKKTVVRYRIAKEGSEAETRTLTPAHVNAFVPVVTQTKEGFLAAYLMEKDNHVGVYLTRLR